MTDYELMFAPGPHREEFKRWKETQAFLYGQDISTSVCLVIKPKHSLAK